MKIPTFVLSAALVAYMIDPANAISEKGQLRRLSEVDSEDDSEDGASSGARELDSLATGEARKNHSKSKSKSETKDGSNIPDQICRESGSKGTGGTKKSGSNKSGSNKSGSNKSGSNKSGSNKSGSEKDHCLTTKVYGMPVTCGNTYHNKAIELNGDLICVNSTGITMDGPHAVLDCDGYTIQGRKFDGEEREGIIGITLTNGAAAINCEVHGFYFGIKTEGGDNLISHSSVINADNDGIRVTGEGCQTIESTKVYGVDDDGIDIRSDGTLVLSDVDIKYNDGEGLDFSGSSNIHVFIFNSEISSNEEIGIETDDSNDGVSIHLKFYGTNKIEKNGEEGLNLRHRGTTIFYGDTHITGNTESGLYIDNSDQKVIFAADSTTTICNNNLENDAEDADIETADVYKIYDYSHGGLTCDTKEGDEAESLYCKPCPCHDCYHGKLCF